MLALLAPGQGAQTPGMLAAWLELPGAAERLAAWSQISGLDLARLGTTATAEEITDTAVTQPLVVAATLLAHEELTRRGLLAGKDTVVAGHSVGEIAAYAIAGVISADDAVKLAATRGSEMAKACALEPTATLLSNADGQPVSSATDAMSKLVSQLTRPVRWDLCTETLRQQNVTAIVEFPPAGTLAGIAKRELRGVPTHAVKSPADLDGLAELSGHDSRLAGE